MMLASYEHDVGGDRFSTVREGSMVVRQGSGWHPDHSMIRLRSKYVLGKIAMVLVT
jgi:hypothetical protein